MKLPHWMPVCLRADEWVLVFPWGDFQSWVTDD